MSKKTELEIFKKEEEIYNKKFLWEGIYSVYLKLFGEYIDKTYKNAYLSPFEYEINTINFQNLRYCKTGNVYHKKINKKEKLFTIPEELQKDFESNKKKRFIIYILGLKGLFNHTNCVIYDTKLETLEFFDPYGSLKTILVEHINKNLVKEIEDQIDLGVKEFVCFLKQKYNVKKLKIFKPENFLPAISFQSIEEIQLKCSTLSNIMPIYTKIGFCFIWTLFYIEQRLKYPNIDKKVLVERILEQIKSDDPNSEKGLCKLITNYSGFVVNMYKKLPASQRLKVFLKYGKKEIIYNYIFPWILNGLKAYLFYSFF